jgi:hypothetical protein
VNRSQARHALHDIPLVHDPALRNAAKAGTDAVGREHGIDFEDVALGVKERLLPFAAAAQVRIADDFAQHVDTLLQHPDLDQEIEAFNRAVQAKLDALQSDVTRYAEPPWNAGYIGYGQGLGDYDIRLVWVSENDENTCDDCADMDAGSPYAVGDLETWPGSGDTQCLDRCRCEIQPDEDDWADAFGSEGADQ